MHWQAHLYALVLDALDGINDAVLVHSLVLIHIRAETARSHDEEDELVNSGALLVLVTRGALVVVDPVLDEGLESRIGGDYRVYRQLMRSIR